MPPDRETSAAPQEAVTPLPRPEYPRPQFVRRDWLCLNGPWEFEIDHVDTGLERKVHEKPALDGRITVPFCPEAPLSGFHHTDFMSVVWYRRTVTIPTAWRGKNVLLHFGAVDYDATVWVNGQEVGRHRGGFTPFTLSLKGIVKAGQEMTIVVRARDTAHDPQPRGKQSIKYANTGCHYYRTTGIWQTVWMEPVPDVSLRRTRITPDVANGCFLLEQPLSNNRPGLRFRAILHDDQGEIVRAETRADLDLAPRLTLAVPPERRRPWHPGDPHLYSLRLELVDAKNKVVDAFDSYAGLRSVAIDGQAVKINGEVVFQRLVLDQGFYREGIMTAPDDAALVRDIELSQSAGFNGARLHQKVFEERFFYHADRLGYLLWGEFADWGARMAHGQTNQFDITFCAQWLEALERDYSHPSIVGWCGLNETWEVLTDRIQSVDDATWAMFLCAKAMDTSRPVLDASGYSHRVAETDIYDSHDYEQNPEKFARKHAGLRRGKPYINTVWKPHVGEWSYPYGGQPFFLSEFGGIHWNPKVKPLTRTGSKDDKEADKVSWGYGKSPRTLDEFYSRFEGLCNVLLNDPHMFGYCYTQLTDVFQEENGLYDFDRNAKFDTARLHAIQTRVAAMEKAGGAAASSELAAPGRPEMASSHRAAIAPAAKESFASLMKEEAAANFEAAEKRARTKP